MDSVCDDVVISDPDERIHTPHDKIFKKVLGCKNEAQHFVRRLLPHSWLATLDLTTIEAMPGSFIDEKLKGSACDLIYRACSSDGIKDAYLFTLIEYQSSPDKTMPHRLWLYMLRAMERYKNKADNEKKPYPLIYLILVYNADVLIVLEKAG